MARQLTHLSYDERLAALLDSTRLARFRVVRGLYVVAAVLLIGVGVAGISIPGFPGTVFLLVALWLASRSSERLHRWMLTNRLFGRQLVDYESGFGIPRRIKLLIIAVILGFTALAAASVETTWVLALDIALAIYGVWFVASRPTRESVVTETRATG